MSEVAAASTAATTANPSDSSAQTQASESQSDNNSQPAQAEAKAKALKKYKLQIDGEEQEAEIDLNDDEAVRKELQLSRAAKKRMAEAKDDKKKAYEIIKAFEADPQTMLKRLGPKGREIAEQYLLEQINDEMLSPEQKRLRDLEAENKGYKDKEEKIKSDQEAKAQADKEYKYAQAFQATIIEALDKSGMPKTANHIKALARLMSKNLELGLDLTPQELADEWAQERTQDYSSDFKEMSAEQFIKLYGADMAKKLQKHAIKELQEKQSQIFQSGPAKVSGGGGESKQARPMSMDEWKESVERRIK